MTSKVTISSIIKQVNNYVKDNLKEQNNSGNIKWTKISSDKIKEILTTGIQEILDQNATKLASKNKKKDKDSLKKNKSSYIFFCSSKREEVKNNNDGISNTEITIKLAQLWKQLSDEDKKPFEDLAQQDKLRYNNEMTEYTEKNKNSEVESKIKSSSDDNETKSSDNNETKSSDNEDNKKKSKKNKKTSSKSEEKLNSSIGDNEAKEAKSSSNLEEDIKKKSKKSKKSSLKSEKKLNSSLSEEKLNMIDDEEDIN